MRSSALVAGRQGNADSAAAQEGGGEQCTTQTQRQNQHRADASIQHLVLQAQLLHFVLALQQLDATTIIGHLVTVLGQRQAPADFPPVDLLLQFQCRPGQARGFHWLILRQQQGNHPTVCVQCLQGVVGRLVVGQRLPEKPQGQRIVTDATRDPPQNENGIGLGTLLCHGAGQALGLLCRHAGFLEPFQANQGAGTLQRAVSLPGNTAKTLAEFAGLLGVGQSLLVGPRIIGNPRKASKQWRGAHRVGQRPGFGQAVFQAAAGFFVVVEGVVEQAAIVVDAIQIQLRTGMIQGQCVVQRLERLDKMPLCLEDQGHMGERLPLSVTVTDLRECLDDLGQFQPRRGQLALTTQQQGQLHAHISQDTGVLSL